MKRPTMLVQSLLIEFGRVLDLSVERDVATLRRRTEHEGFSFLTLTLPTLSDALEQGLESGRLSVPTSFAVSGRLPRFMGGFFSRVFTKTGEPLQDPDPESIYAIRQICRFFKKLKISCSADRLTAAERRFIEVEEELGQLTPSIVGRKDSYLDKVSGVIWSQVFPEIDPLEIVCQHGPGVTADRLGSNERFQLTKWYDRFEHTFPADLHAFPNYGWAWDASGGSDRHVQWELDYLGVRDEIPVRVVFVPKTQTTPRVIAIEPSCMQYVQQGLMHYTVPILESHRLTRNSIRFTDQTVNQRLAHRSSIDRSLATLDLKDASDRVHLGLVRRIFKTSGILEYLEDARSLHAILPNGRNLILNKYASQGSAMCFPVEAMVFYTLIQAAMHEQDGRCPSSSSIMGYSAQIDVYGDDLIVPVDYTDRIVDKLEAYGLRVNVNKSFRSSLFRESCGGDYYNGYSVKPVYARQLPPDDRRDWTPSQIMAWVSTSDQLYHAGLWTTTQVIREMVEEVIGQPVPRSSLKRGDGLYFDSVFMTTGLRFTSSFCGYEQRRIVYQPTKKKDDIDGLPIPCLNKTFLSQAGKLRLDRILSRTDRFDHLRKSPLPDLERDRGDALQFHRGALGKSEDFGDSVYVTGSHRSSDRPEHHSGDGGLPCIVKPISLSESNPSTGITFEVNETPLTGTDYSRDGLAVQLTSGGSSVSSSEVRWTPHDSSGKFDSLIGGGPTMVLGRTSLDYKSSVKRGGFKSKRRWITLIT